MERPLVGILPLCALSAVVGACSGQIVAPAPVGRANQEGSAGSPAGMVGGEKPGAGMDRLPPPAAGVGQGSACSTGKPGPRLLRRLTAAQLTATLRDLFHADAGLPAVTVFSDPSVLGFSSDAHALLVQGLNAQQLADNAESVAHWAVTRQLGRLSPCMTNDAPCRQQFVRAFGRRAFREPLSDERARAYEALPAAESSFAEGAEVVITAMLQSPYFLYRRELGGGGAGDLVKLTPHEVASSLSYLLTGSMPDDQLLTAADNGQLASAEQIEQHAQRLLQGPRALDAVMDFFTGWLGLDRLERVVKDDTVFKLSPSLKSAMAGETRAYLVDAFTRNATVADLFAAPHSFLNQELAQFYGVYPRDGTQLPAGTFTRVTYPSDARRDPGLLAHGGILTGNADAAISSPVLRGKLVRTRLLCQELPPPPADVDTKLKPSAAAKTTREHFAQHAKDPACASCHR
ncbi:MAG TPA: DUF1592 domain-containing protein, partial [Polyangia bacterium]